MDFDVGDSQTVSKMSQKIVHGIRHGEAWHNVLYKTLGKDAFTNYADSTLTVCGMSQAVEGRQQVVPDIVYVSPLTRTLQTATLMFPGVRMVALECLKEYPQHTEIVNRRSDKSKLELLFPHVEFTQIKVEEDCLFGIARPLEILERSCRRAREVINQSEAQHIALVTHSSWLKYFMYGSVGDEMDELEHCTPYKIEPDKYE